VLCLAGFKKRNGIKSVFEYASLPNWRYESRIIYVQNKKGGYSEWQIRILYAEIATRNLFSMKANRLSTKKKDLKTNRQDALIAGKQGNSRETITTTAIQATGIPGSIDNKESEPLLFYFTFRRSPAMPALKKIFFIGAGI
jgi:hypothetical protein